MIFVGHLSAYYNRPWLILDLVQKKYKSETGESMEKPSRKLKKTFLITGITGAVYLSFQYLLPLVIPFLIAYIFALALKPSAAWLEKRCYLTLPVRSRNAGMPGRRKFQYRDFHLPLAVIGGVEITILMVVFGVLLYFGVRKLCIEAQLLFDNLPHMISRLDKWLTGCCFFTEELFHLRKGYLVKILRDMLAGGGNALKETAMPFLMVNSMTVLRCFIEFTVITVILFIATILCLSEMEDIRIRRDNSMFHREFALLGNRLMTVGSAWLKTQGSIMVFTVIICTAGLFLMGNPYSILLGIGIGLLDALPIFGTGTVLIPWAVFSLISRDWKYGIGLFLIYIICYFLRQIMEAKVMGNKVGLTPLETLISMYVGMKLFGLLGFILGPIGLLIIEDLVELYGSQGGAH